VVARLRTGITPDQARGELETISAGLASQSAAEKGWMISIKPLQQVIVGDVEQPLLLLLSAAGLVLLIACANIANLLLARATSRSLPSHSRASRLVEHGDDPCAVQQNTLVEIEERREQ